MFKELSIILLASILISCNIKTPEEYFIEACELEEEGDYNRAIEILTKAIKKDPQYRPALLNRGADKSVLGKYREATFDYFRIVDFDSDNTLALYNIGNCYKNLNMYDSAIIYFSKALGTKGALPQGRLQIDLDWNKRTDKEIDFTISNYEIRYLRGLTYAMNKNYDLAINDLLIAVENNYEIPNSFFWIGESYLSLVDTSNAIKFFKKSSYLGIIEAEEILNRIE